MPPRSDRRSRHQSPTSARPAARSAWRSRADISRSRPCPGRSRNRTRTTIGAPLLPAAVRGLAADPIAAHRDQRLATVRPECGDDVGRARTPVETGKDGFLDIQSIHQRDGVEREHGRLAVPESIVGEKARCSVAAQVWDDHPVAGRRQQRRDLGKAVNVIGPAVQKNDRGTSTGPASA